VPLLCGGTLVFDSRGNILSWQRKPGAGKQETGQRLRKYCKEEQDRGIKRREQFLSYIRDRVESGNIGLQEGAGLTRLGIDHR